jgi:hypothetical protein
MSDEPHFAPLLVEIDELVSLKGEIMARHQALFDQVNEVTQQTRRLLINVGRRTGKPITRQT